MADSQMLTGKEMATQPGYAGIRMVPASLFRHLGTLFGLAAALSLGVGIILWAIQPDYMPLYTNLSERDATQVLDTLRAENIPYKVDTRTGMITVPSEKIQNARFKLASTGLPNGMANGFELLQQEQTLGTSQFIETARYQHILETELGRTISAMGNIDNARVHLALPKQSVFIRKEAKPSASVLVKLLPGRVLEKNQVASIIHLVASSVPYMESGRVTVVDQWGSLLTSNDSNDEFVSANKQFDYTRKLEEMYAKRIESLLTPILGMGRAKAEVNTEIDFSIKESTREAFQPATDKVRSEQLQESESSNVLNPIGIPGALSNQPPGAGTTLTGDAESQPTGEEAKPLNKNRNVIRNYELDKTVSHTRDALGEIKRITVAVVVDDRETINDKGKTNKQSLSAEEINLITGLVKEVIGFREERGDSIAVINSTFMEQIKIEPLPEEVFWKNPMVWTWLKQGLAALVVIFMIFGIVKPALRSFSGKPNTQASGNKQLENTSQADGGEEKLTLSLQHKGAEALPAPPKVYGDILNMARAMAVDDPKRVAKVVKDWLASDV